MLNGRLVVYGGDARLRVPAAAVPAHLPSADTRDRTTASDD